VNQISGKEVKSLGNGELIDFLAFGVMMKREVSEIKKTPLRLKYGRRKAIDQGSCIPFTGLPALAPISCQRFTESETLEYTRLDQVRNSTLL